MRFLPVIEREIRSESRHGMNYWMRVLSALVMFVALVLAISSIRSNPNAQGAVLFGVLQPTLFSLIWILGAILTCDCISRERREGTLGLLFLTPVRPVDIAISKALSGMSKTLIVILATLPVLAIPILLGGVSGPDLLRAAMMDFMALIGSVSAGLIASARCREFSRSVVLSLTLSVCFLLVLGNVFTVYLMLQFQTPPSLSNLLPITLFGPWYYCSGIEHFWQNGFTVGARGGLLWISGVQLVATLVIALSTFAYLNRALRRLSVETGMTKRQLWWWNLFCTPKLFRGSLSKTNRALLNRNPIGWLHRRTLSARLATWGWLGFVTMVLSVLLVGGVHWREMLTMFSFVMLGLGPAIAFSAADSFRKERESGAFELLLVTDLTPSRILTGRLSGIWGQYALVLAMITVLWFMAIDRVSVSRSYSGIHAAAWIIFVVGYVCVPIIGLDQSLHQRNFFLALIMTLIFGLAIPVGFPLFLLSMVTEIGELLGYPLRANGNAAVGIFLLTCYLFVKLARRAWNRSHEILTERQFLEREST